MFRFTESKNYIVPIHQKLIDKLHDKGWVIFKEIGRGGTNVAYSAKNSKTDGVVLIPFAQEDPYKYVEKIIQLQKQGKLQALVTIYDWFYTDIIVDKNDLRKNIDDGIVFYPDYVLDNCGYNILILELLLPLTQEEKIHEALDSLYNDGWEHGDIHIENFGISHDGKIKMLDLEALSPI
jgi:serine/threonine protein kinase